MCHMNLPPNPPLIRVSQYANEYGIVDGTG